MSLIAELITDQYGERCPDVDPDCWTCKAWAEFDRLRLPAGWKAVPIEPTHEILTVLSDNRYDVEPGGKANWMFVWNALLDAASPSAAYQAEEERNP